MGNISIFRFLAQSYSEATRNTLLPVLLSAMRLVQHSCHSDPHQADQLTPHNVFVNTKPTGQEPDQPQTTK